MEDLLARFRSNKAAEASKVCINSAEAERIVNDLALFDLCEVGNPAWFAHHDSIEKLNLQAHINAQRYSDEFVKETLVSLDKTTLLVKDLLLTEVWLEKLYPLLKHHLAENVDSVSIYLILYHETSLSNLLEVLLFHQDACESVSEDALLELCDWCCRKLNYLATEAQQHSKRQEASLQEMLDQSPLQDLEHKKQELQFNTAMCALSIIRYLTDHMDKVSLGLMSRLVFKNDAAFGLLQLLNRPPWVRKGKEGLEKYIDGKWQAVEPRDRLKLTQQDGQVWLALYNIVMDPACRAKMNLTDARSDALFKLKRYFSDLLLDQLPVLKDLQRVIDELAFGSSGEPLQATQTQKLIVEQAPMIRSSMLQRTDWEDLAQHAMLHQFGSSGRQLSQAHIQSMLKAIDLMGDLEGGGNAKQVATGPPTNCKLEAYRAVKEGIWEWWATYNLDIDVEKPGEPISVAAAPMPPSQEDVKDSNNPAGAAFDENIEPEGNQYKSSRCKGQKNSASRSLVNGQRYRLHPLAETLQRPLPAHGKLSVLVNGHTCQASFELPVSETRDTTALPPSVWVTVGSLSRDGLALQLKLKRLTKPTERDKVLGVWYPYAPVAGALSIQEGLLN